jgi:hypothetical protein
MHWPLLSEAVSVLLVAVEANNAPATVKSTSATLSASAAALILLSVTLKLFAVPLILKSQSFALAAAPTIAPVTVLRVASNSPLITSGMMSQLANEADSMSPAVTVVDISASV